MPAKLLLTFLALLPYLLKAQINTKDLQIDTGVKISAIGSTPTDTWIGTTQGVFKINKKTKKVAHLLKENSALPSNNVTSLCPRKNGDIWIGTSKGILRYDNFTYLIINHENSSLPENTITSMAEDNQGNMWLGTLNSGLVKVHQNKFKTFTTRNSILPSNTIFSLSADDKGNVWVAPYMKGLVQVNGKKWNAVTFFDSTSTVNVSFVLSKNDSALYIGTSKNGLFVYQEGKLTREECSRELSEKMRYLTTITTVKKLVVGCQKGLYFLKDLSDVKDTKNLLFYDDYTFLEMTFLMDF